MSNLNNLSKIELQLILKNHVDSLKKTELIEMIKNLNLHKPDADNHKAFIDETKSKIIKSKISREKDIKKVASLIVQPKIKPKTNTNENAWVKHLQYIKSIEDVSHQQAMKMAKDSKNKYFYKPKPKEVVKQKKEKKVNTCGICEKVFFDKSGLNRHMQLHKIELSKIRGLIKRQEFFLKNNNVNPDDRENAPDIIAELKARFLFIASHFKEDGPPMKAPNKVKPVVVKTPKEKKHVPYVSSSVIDDLVNRLNKNYDGELNLTRDMITDSKKNNDGDITLHVRDLEIDDGEKIDSIILAYDEDHDGYNVLLMQRVSIKGSIEDMEYDEFFIY